MESFLRLLWLFREKSLFIFLIFTACKNYVKFLASEKFILVTIFWGTIFCCLPKVCCYALNFRKSFQAKMKL